MSKIGDRIRMERLRYGMAQAELARRSKLSTTAMNDIEKGKTADPGFSVVQRIAGVLGVTLDELSQELHHASASPG